MNKENNQTPEQYYSSNQWREKVAQAIARGIESHEKLNKTVAE